MTTFDINKNKCPEFKNLMQLEMASPLAFAQASGSKQRSELCLKAHSACFVPEFCAVITSMQDQSEVECVFGAEKCYFWDQMPQNDSLSG